ncbi:MAG: zf-HC2 domain-containing protein [Thermaerobacter sp.]|jgi:predicted anti-sigma-YlaC factor YlaD|nr:zf-HC2 domain-containing protein [Thermaerobacter sp.]
MRCAEVDLLLWPYAAGRLPDAAVQGLSEHLAGCPECRERFAGLSGLREALEGEWLAPPPGFPGRVAARVRTARRRGSVRAVLLAAVAGWVLAALADATFWGWIFPAAQLAAAGWFLAETAALSLRDLLGQLYAWAVLWGPWPALAAGTALLAGEAAVLGRRLRSGGGAR